MIHMYLGPCIFRMMVVATESAITALVAINEQERLSEALSNQRINSIRWNYLCEFAPQLFR